MSASRSDGAAPALVEDRNLADETIAAVATPAGMGALAVVRMSGGQALSIADHAFSGKVVPSRARDRSILVGEIAGADGIPIDQVVMLVMRGPATTTGDDVIEISTHGGVLAPRLVLRRLVELGARPAEPGEFTKRAFLNGKIDLAQAEAVEEIVRASSDKALRAAMRQLRGDLSRDLGDLEGTLLGWLSLIEANIDFPEDDVEAVDLGALAKALDCVCGRLDDLVRAQEGGRYLRDGLDVVIIGKPNVGKSSLFNRLLGKDRVIVSETPGTTRDVVDGLVGLDGVVVKIHDTAGVRDAADRVEKEAVRRSREAIAEADLALVVFDASKAGTPEDYAMLEEASGKPRIVVGNKVDLADDSSADDSLVPGEACVKVSALTGWGLSDLAALLAEQARGRLGDLEYDLIANERHAAHLRSALESLRRAADGLRQGLSLEFIASDIRDAADSLGEISGRNVASRVLEEIFSRFCIGK